MSTPTTRKSILARQHEMVDKTAVVVGALSGRTIEPDPPIQGGDFSPVIATSDDAEDVKATAEKTAALIITRGRPLTSITITDPSQAQSLIDFINDDLRPAKAFILSKLDPMREKLHALWKDSIANIKALTDPIDRIETSIRASLNAWDAHLRQIQQEAARKAAEELRKALEAEELERISQMAENGAGEAEIEEAVAGVVDGSTAASILSTLPTPKPQGAVAVGMSSRAPRKLYRVLDVGKVHERFLKPREVDHKAVQALISTHGKGAELMVGAKGAIEYYEESSVAFHGSKPVMSEE